MKIEDLILPGAILIGAYFLLTKLGDITKPITDVIGGVGQLDQPVITQPKEIKGVTISPKVTAPTPINYGMPVTGLPGFVEFATTNPYTEEKSMFAVRDSLVFTTALVAQDLGLIKKETAIKTSPQQKATIPIVTKGTSKTASQYAVKTPGVTILRPLEIVKAGQAIKATNAYKKPGGM
jgi:hypothetical protein